MSNINKPEKKTVNVSPYYDFYSQILKGEVHLTYRPNNEVGAEEGRLIKVDGDLPGSGLRLLQLHKEGDDKPQLEGNPANTALIMPGGMNVAVPILDKEEDKIYYLIITIPVYKMEGRKEDGSPLLSEAIPVWEDVKF